MDLKLELVVVPVSDVDLAKAFYEGAGFRVDVDHQAGPDFRMVQRHRQDRSAPSPSARASPRPPPGSNQGLHLVVTDIEAAWAEVVARGMEVGEIFHFGLRARCLARTRNAVTTARSRPSATLTATGGCSRR